MSLSLHTDYSPKIGLSDQKIKIPDLYRVYTVSTAVKNFYFQLSTKVSGYRLIIAYFLPTADGGFIVIFTGTTAHLKYSSLLISRELILILQGHQFYILRRCRLSRFDGVSPSIRFESPHNDLDFILAGRQTEKVEIVFCTKIST